MMPCSSRHLTGSISRGVDEMGAAEGLDLLFFLRPLAFVADRLGIDPDEGTLGRELPGQGSFGHGPDLLGHGRTAGHPIIHVHDLVQRPQDLEQGRQGQPPERGFRDSLGQRRVPGLDGRRFPVDIVQDLVRRRQIGQAGDAALVGAGSEGDQDLGLLPQKLGDVEVFLVADASVEQGDVDLAVGHRLDVLVLGVHEARTEDQVRRGVEIQDLLPDVEKGDLAPAAAGRPVDREFRLRHG